MGAAPTTIRTWPVSAACWVPGYDDQRHYVPDGGGVIGLCGHTLPTPPVESLPATPTGAEISAECCVKCVRLALLGRAGAVA